MAVTLFCWHTDSTSLADLEQGIFLALKSNAKSLLILSCNQNNYPEEHVNDLLLQLPIPVCGGIYPLVIHQKKVIEQGALIIGFESELSVANFTDIDAIKDECELENYLSDNRYRDTIAHNSFLMFYDCLVNSTEEFLDSLFELLDHEITIAGGGAGNLDFIQYPCIFTNQGLLVDTIQLVGLPHTLNIGVAHGWETFEGPFLVSEAEGQIVSSLNYRPAFDTYKQIIESASDYRFDTLKFFEIAKHFPLGIEDINHDLVVRDPIITFNNQLKCLGHIPVNSMVYLLKGDVNTLVDSARKAAITSLNTNNTTEKIANNISQKALSDNNHEFSNTMVFDCISRVLYLQDSFSKEIDAIAAQCSHNNLFGVLSLGEVSKNKSGTIRLLNKSTVIASW
jgi:hypothetical protein